MPLEVFNRINFISALRLAWTWCLIKATFDKLYAGSAERQLQSCSLAVFRQWLWLICGKYSPPDHTVECVVDATIKPVGICKVWALWCYERVDAGDSLINHEWSSGCQKSKDEICCKPKIIHKLSPTIPKKVEDWKYSNWAKVSTAVKHLDPNQIGRNIHSAQLMISL